MVVNGGGVLTVRYEKEGYLDAQRQVDVPWQDFTHLPDVVLVPYDSKATTVTPGDNSPMQVVRGSTVSDKDGTRTATLIIPAGVQAETVLPDGSRESLDSLTVRATEYTVGENGPQAMPPNCSPNVGYTYCVDYSADEPNTSYSVNRLYTMWKTLLVHLWAALSPWAITTTSRLPGYPPKTAW